MAPPSAAASPDAVRAAALRLLGSLAPGRLLDVPCGTGLLAVRLRDAGWRVQAVDREPSLARALGLDAVAADMEGPLPFADGCFDAVACVEGIEHIEGQEAFLRECGRVLAPGGHLALTTPNVLGAPSRRALARYGYARFFRPRPAGSGTPYEHEHRHPIDVVRLEFLLREAGLVPVSWDSERGPDGSPSWRGRLRHRLAARRLPRHNARADLLLEPAVFHGRVLAVLARKAPPS